jgi:isocitrate dehydrogenase
MKPIKPRQHAPKAKTLVGVDVMMHWNDAGRSPAALGERVKKATADISGVSLKMISNRGVKVWPEGFSETFCTDHWRCRFLAEGTMQHQKIVEILGALNRAGLDFIKTENLVAFDGQKAYSLGQGE